MKSSEIVHEVREVLSSAAKGKGPAPHFLTSYQVLHRLPEHVRDKIIEEYNLPGRGAKANYTAATIVSEALRALGDKIEIVCMDNRGISFDIGEEQVRAGYPVCNLYRLRQLESDSE
jgi:hypothetical protein